MLELTNKTGLPQPIVDAMAADSYRGGGEISVTSLIDNVQVRYLRKRHPIEEDAADRVFALFGSAIHNILERANVSDHKRRAFLMVIDDITERAKRIVMGKEDTKSSDFTYDKMEAACKWIFNYMQAFFPELQERYLFEVRLFWSVDGMEISGQFDIYDKIDKVLDDYKVCSVWSYIYPESRVKWEEQMNIYAKMLRLSGYEVNSARIIAIFRDWSKSKSEQQQDFPKQQIVTIDIPLWSDEQVVLFVKQRVYLHQQADLGNVRECDGKERWATSTTYAVKAKGGVKALPNSRCDTIEQAEKYVKENEHKYVGIYIETRPGENKRCDNYCPVREVCPQRKRMLEENTQKQ